MPLFKVARTLNHNLITYEPYSIHDFPYCESIQHLVDTDVLIPIYLPETTICPTCGTRAIEVIEGKTHFYKSDKSDVIMKQETCAKCRSILKSKARPEELKKIKEGSLKVEKRTEKKKHVTEIIFTKE